MVMDEPRKNHPNTDLPEGWVWCRLGEVADAQPGLACGKKDVQDGLIHLRMNNIGDDCSLNMDLIRRVPLAYKAEEYLLKKGDLLFCHTNSSKLVGKNAIFNLDGEYAYSNHLTRLRINRLVISARWLWCVLTLLEGRFEQECKHWVNQSTLPQDKLAQLPISLPPLPEQRLIVARVEVLFKFADEVEKRVQEARKQVERITQSILVRAFRGELTADFREAVRNWRSLSEEERRKYLFTLPEEEQEKALHTDEFPMEPAERLLEHIREECTTRKLEGKRPKAKGRKRQAQQLKLME